MLDPEKLIDAGSGVEHLIQALSSWEETSELKTYELFDKAMYRVSQKSDEATHSYTLRLQAAFNDLGPKVGHSSGDASVRAFEAVVLVEWGQEEDLLHDWWCTFSAAVNFKI